MSDAFNRLSRTWMRSIAVEVPHTSTTFGRVPDNTMMLSIFVYFEQGGDAAYYWALGDLP